MHLLMDFIEFEMIWFVDVDECSTTNGGCAQTCVNTDGSHYCTCNEGFELNADKRRCDGKWMFEEKNSGSQKFGSLISLLVPRRLISCIFLTIKRPF